jgi:hypothetical protein
MATEGSRFFFSYAREDSELVLRLARELRKAGANLWLDQLDIRGGQRWDEAVQAALESCQGLVAVLSPSSVVSQNFLDEVSYALEKQKQIIPLLHQECAIPFRLRRLQYVNFVDNYSDGFDDLLQALERPKEEPRDGEITGAVLQPVSRKARHEAFLRRMIAMLAGAVAGANIGAAASFFGDPYHKEPWIGSLVSGFFWAMTGLITGTNRKLILFTLSTSLMGVIYVSNRGPEKFAIVRMFGIGAPVGAFLGALAILLWTIMGMIDRRLNR